MMCFVSNFLGAKHISLNLGLGVLDAINDFVHLARNRRFTAIFVNR